MERTVMMTSVSQEQLTTAKMPKVQKKKKKPIKVKYISNPMKIKTSASRFRSLVQELTGQYAAESPAEMAEPAVPDVSRSGAVEESLLLEGPPIDDQEPFDDGADLVPDYFEPLDADDFVHQMVGNVSGYLSSGIHNVDALGFVNNRI